MLTAVQIHNDNGSFELPIHDELRFHQAKRCGSANAAANALQQDGITLTAINEGDLPAPLRSNGEFGPADFSLFEGMFPGGEIRHFAVIEH